MSVFSDLISLRLPLAIRKLLTSCVALPSLSRITIHPLVLVLKCSSRCRALPAANGQELRACSDYLALPLFVDF